MFILGFFIGGLIGIGYMVIVQLGTITDLQIELDNERYNNIKLEQLYLELRNVIHGIEVIPIDENEKIISILDNVEKEFEENE